MREGRLLYGEHRWLLVPRQLHWLRLHRRRHRHGRHRCLPGRRHNRRHQIGQTQKSAAYSLDGGRRPRDDHHPARGCRRWCPRGDGRLTHGAAERAMTTILRVAAGGGAPAETVVSPTAASVGADVLCLHGEHPGGRRGGPAVVRSRDVGNANDNGGRVRVVHQHPSKPCFGRRLHRFAARNPTVPHGPFQGEPIFNPVPLHPAPPGLPTTPSGSVDILAIIHGGHRATCTGGDRKSAAYSLDGGRRTRDERRAWAKDVRRDSLDNVP